MFREAHKSHISALQGAAPAPLDLIPAGVPTFVQLREGKRYSKARIPALGS